jgi:hypothetical protein
VTGCESPSQCVEKHRRLRADRHNEAGVKGLEAGGGSARRGRQQSHEGPLGRQWRVVGARREAVAVDF